MKKIPTLFVREFENHRVVKCTEQVTPGLEWVLEAPNGENGIATIKYDGACCAIFDGVFYKRYDAKRGKTPPAGAIPCCDPDPVTGHWPHWVPCRRDDPADKWFFSAFDRLEAHYDGTYEAIGPHFRGNPYGYLDDFLIKHGEVAAVVERSYDGIRRWLAEHFEEGLVFWKDGKPQCKIKRSDFGFPWPIVTEEPFALREHLENSGLRLENGRWGVPADTTRDAVPVVRCMDCKYYHYGRTSLLVQGDNIKAGWCQRRIRYDEEFRMLPRDFCSYGER